MITGHGDPARPGLAADWERLATAVDILVVLMGVAAWPSIASRLVAAGRPAATPAAVIRWGTTGAQQVAGGTLGDIAERAAHLAPPAVVVIGEVARLASLGEFAEGFVSPCISDRGGQLAGDAAAVGCLSSCCF